jgi:hypothetical protein
MDKFESTLKHTGHDHGYNHDHNYDYTLRGDRRRIEKKYRLTSSRGQKV